MSVLEARMLDPTHLELSEPVDLPRGSKLVVSVVEADDGAEDRQQWLAASAVTLQSVAAMVLALVCLSSPARADVSEIGVQVATDRQAYLTGDPVTITVTKCNPTQSPITVTHNCPCCHDTIEVLDPAGATVANCTPGCPQVVVDITWQPGECKTDTFVWHQTSPYCSAGAQVDGGQYLVRHLWEFPPFSSSTLSPPFLIGSVIDIPTLSPLGYLALVLLLCVAAIRFLRQRGPDNRFRSWGEV